MTTRYNQIPEAAPKPKLWKSVGHVMAGLEAHYALDSWRAELDFDREIELRDELITVAATLMNNGQAVDGLHLAKDEIVRDRGFFGSAHFGVVTTQQRIIRFCVCTCHERGPVMNCN